MPVSAEFQRARRARREKDIPYLLQALVDIDQPSRWLAAKGLGELKVEEAVAPLLRGALRSNDEIFRSHCIQALGKIGDIAAVPSLYELANQDDLPFSIKTNAMRSLAELGDRRAIPMLAQIMTDPDLTETYSVPTTLPRPSNGPAKRWVAEQLIAFKGVEALPYLERGKTQTSLGDRVRIWRLARRLRSLGS